MNRRFLLVSLFYIAAAAASHAQNLLANGSFELGAWVQNSFFPGRMDVPNGSTVLNNWLVGRADGNFWWLQGPLHYNPQDGNYCVDLDSNLNAPATYIEQTFPTTIGQQYSVSLYLAGEGNGGPATLSLQIDGVAIGASSAGSGAGGSEPDYNYLVWTNISFSFTAASASSTLRLQDATVADLHNSIIDNVSVVAVPEPSVCAFACVTILSLVARRRTRPI